MSVSSILLNRSQGQSLHIIPRYISLLNIAIYRFLVPVADDGERKVVTRSRRHLLFLAHSPKFSRNEPHGGNADDVLDVLLSHHDLFLFE